ncbi:WEB family protein At5g55860-like [Silene latifolia]|uniref:WEB family protein At5g55860-like n=1 Tax=Silene latifolia TaxID=37657 RepID=UPI003D7768B9
MVNIVRTRRNSMGGGSPRAAEVGEIDTKAPFASVRAAVSLFGETISPKAKAKPIFTKKSKSQTEVHEVLDKEAQFHLALNELNKLKEQVRGSECARADTLPELDKAKRTLEELSLKLNVVNESKHSIIEVADALNIKAQKLEQAVLDSEKYDNAETKRHEYKAAIAELDAAKQELSNMRREFDATCEAKIRAFRKTQQAELAADAHGERIKELSKQVAAMQEALAQIKASSKQAVQQHDEVLANKDQQLLSCRVAKEQVEQKLLALKVQHLPLLTNDDLESKLAEADAEIASLEEEVKNARAAFLEAQKATSLELEIAKGSLEQVELERTSLQTFMESLKCELQQVGKELSEQKHKLEEVEGVASKIRSEIQDKKEELEAGLVNKTSAANASDDMASSLEQLKIETQRAIQEAQQMKKITEEHILLAKTTREMTTEMEKKLPSVLKQVEEAKALETSAEEDIKVISQKCDNDSASTSESNESSKIKLSQDEYNSLTEKVNESEKLADIKVAAAMAHVEALVANQQEAAKKYEAYSKAIEELKMAEEEALKAAEMAEAATNVLEAELERIREQDQIIKVPQLN